MKYDYAISVQPTTEPVTKEELQEILRIDSDDHDSYLDTLILAARQWAETYCRRQFITATIQAYFADWPLHCMDVPRGNLIAVTSLEYIPANSSSYTTISSSLYRKLPTRIPGTIEFDSSFVYAGLDTRQDAIRVTYTAGYGASPSDVPENIKEGIRRYAVYLFCKDEAQQDAAQTLLKPFRIKYN